MKVFTVKGEDVALHDELKNVACVKLTLQDDELAELAKPSPPGQFHKEIRDKNVLIPLHTPAEVAKMEASFKDDTTVFKVVVGDGPHAGAGAFLWIKKGMA